MLTQATVSAMLYFAASAAAAPSTFQARGSPLGRRDGLPNSPQSTTNTTQLTNNTTQLTANNTQVDLTNNTNIFATHGIGPGVVNGNRTIIPLAQTVIDDKSSVNPALLWRGLGPAVTDLQLGQVGDYAFAAVASAIINSAPLWLPKVIFAARPSAYNDDEFFNPGIGYIAQDNSSDVHAKPMSYVYATYPDKYNKPEFYVNLFKNDKDRTTQTKVTYDQLKRGDSIPNRAWIDVLEQAGSKEVYPGEKTKSCPSEDPYAIHRQHWFRLLTRDQPLALQLAAPDNNSTQGNFTTPSLNYTNDGLMDATTWPLVDQYRAFFNSLAYAPSAPAIVSTKMKTDFLPPDADLVLTAWNDRNDAEFNQDKVRDLQVTLVDPFNQTNLIVQPLSKVMGDTRFVVSTNTTLQLPIDFNNVTQSQGYRK